MAVVRSFLLVLGITLASQSVAFAQGDIDPVAVAADADHDSQCDDIGWSVLLSEIEANSVEIPHHMACNYGVGAMLMGYCIDPITHAEAPNAGGPDIGQAYMICGVGINSVDGNSFDVKPSDFYVITDSDERFPVDEELTTELLFTSKLVASTTPPDGFTVGKMVFVVPDDLSIPHLLVWIPSPPVDQGVVAIIVDRLVTFEEFVEQSQ